MDIEYDKISLATTRAIYNYGTTGNQQIHNLSCRHCYNLQYSLRTKKITPLLFKDSKIHIAQMTIVKRTKQTNGT